MDNKLKNIIPSLKSKFSFNYDISKNIWFKAGGKVKVFCLVYDLKELEIILKNIDNIPYEIIGAGSNILIRDKGFDGIIFKLGKNFNKITLQKKYLEVGAGILDINFSKFAQINNIADFEFYSGIPGTIGGAIKMNAGCYGSETKDNLISIQTISSKGELITTDVNNLNFSYRSSTITSGNIIILARYKYSYGDKLLISKNIKNIRLMREKSQPLKTKTGGSTFKNPINNYAAKLIEDTGCKGLQVGDAVVSHKHANFLINLKNATATEIEDLGKEIIDRVYKKFDIMLDWEIKIIGKK